MDLRGATTLALLSTVLLALAGGCTTDFAGQQGNIQFKYEATGYSFGERAPIAVGAKLRVRGAPATENVGPETGTTTDAGRSSGGGGLQFTSVTSTKPSVVAVVDTSVSRFTLAGEKAGTATIRVEATAGGETLTDAFKIKASEATQVTMSHRCKTEESLAPGDIAYFSGQKAHFRYQMSGEEGPLAGYGAYPVEVTGSTDVAVDSGYERVGFLQVETGSKAGTAKIEPNVRGESLSVQVVDPSSAESFVWPQRAESGDGTFRDVPVGDVRYIHPRFKVGERTVCQSASTLEVQSDTTDVCNVSVTDEIDSDKDPFGVLYGAYRAIEVEGVSAGSCEIQVALPAAEADVTDQLQVEIVEN